jgi:hypothetical protein
MCLRPLEISNMHKKLKNNCIKVRARQRAEVSAVERLKDRLAAATEIAC